MLAFIPQENPEKLLGDIDVIAKYLSDEIGVPIEGFVTLWFMRRSRRCAAAPPTSRSPERFLTRSNLGLLRAGPGGALRQWLAFRLSSMDLAGPAGTGEKILTGLGTTGCIRPNR